MPRCLNTQAVAWALLLGGSAAAASAQTTVSATVSADSVVSSAQPNANYGNAGQLDVAASGPAPGEFDALIRFDTAAARSSFDTAYGAGNWTIQTLSLTLTSTQPNIIFVNAGAPTVNASGQFTVNWMDLGETWVEGTGTPNNPAATGVTFSNQPSAVNDQPLGTFSFPGGISGTNTYTLASSAGVQSEVSLPTSFLSLRLLPVDSNISYAFNSRNAGGGGGGGSGAAAPLLTLTAIPEPGFAGLFLAGVAALGAHRRRRRNLPNGYF